ncbi:oxidoreductase [Kutzneria kofuensis]|uniref:NAD(P)-dependent dehydrogenase (Short-subunit alcohol dehydrogenase family) n=1 Tax=Kutzneria kofuensis TaxID=103725 RepID=A0A7W9NL91_9PSEU|nr:oxidoreductase [Kutzneria kofuensis]MBB5896514.1 NAD(P)-dependent dehydrogenase (short-subunit alcohol dehydrogenase family) [Kutzneria kofuensis]
MNTRVAVVSGGTKGIGAAVVERLRKDGYAVVTGSRSAVPEHGEDLTVVRADLATAEGVEALAAAALQRGRVDALVNNVGQFDARSSFLDVTDAQWEQGFAANVLSAVRLTRALLPALLERGGAVVNVSSINARLPFPMVVDYSAHKAALTNLTTTLSEEFAPRGVRVNAVSPGPVRTPGWTDDGRLADGMAAASGATREQVLDEGVPTSMGIALGRMGEADEIADAIAFLLGPQARWITGTDLVIDGGTIKTA